MFHIKEYRGFTLLSLAQLVGESFHKPKGHWFEPWSGHFLGCGFHPLSGYTWEATNQCFSLTSMFSPFLFPSFPLSWKSINMSLGEDKKIVQEFLLIYLHINYRTGTYWRYSLCWNFHHYIHFCICCHWGSVVYEQGHKLWGIHGSKF